jgi:hypothetical protein
MRVLILSCLLCFSGNVLSQSQQEVSDALDKMKSSGKQLMGMDKAKYNSLLNSAKEKANDPAVQKKALEVYQKQKEKVGGN